MLSIISSVAIIVKPWPIDTAVAATLTTAFSYDQQLILISARKPHLNHSTASTPALTLDLPTIKQYEMLNSFAHLADYFASLLAISSTV